MHLASRTALIGFLVFAPRALAADGGVDGGVDDAGASVDAGDPDDAGALADAGPLEEDAGDPDDAGTFSDAGISGDAGFSDDGGLTDDAGTDTDAGVVVEDGGGETCAPFCSGSDLVFCDDEAGTEIAVDCAALDGRCGLLDDAWGYDCLLPAGATCAAGYAEGRSRCDPDLNLFCSEGVCSTTLPGDEVPPSIPGSAGGIGTVTDGDQHPLWFLGCTDANSPTIPFFGLTMSLWWLARRRRTTA